MKSMQRPPIQTPRLTDAELQSMLERGELSASAWYRRKTLLALTDMAAQAKRSHDPMSRWRLRTFRAELDRMEGNDEIEVSGEILCETVMHAMASIASR